MEEPFADPAAAVPQDLMKAPVLRAIGEVVAEVPFAEHSCPVAVGGEDLGHGGFVAPQQTAAEDGGPHSRPQIVPAGHQGGAGRGAQRRDVEIGRANALGVEIVQMHCLEHRVAVARQIAVALVVGEDQDHVGPGRGPRTVRLRP